MKEPEKDPVFRELMSMSKLEMPFPDFEDKVIMQLKKQELHTETITHNIKIAWAFFIMGTLFGLFLAIQLPGSQVSFLGVSPKIFEWMFQLLFSFFVLFGVDYLYRYSRKINFNEIIYPETSGNSYSKNNT